MSVSIFWLLIVDWINVIKEKKKKKKKNDLLGGEIMQNIINVSTKYLQYVPLNLLISDYISLSIQLHI